MKSTVKYVVPLIAIFFVLVAMTTKITAPTSRIGFASSANIMKSLPETRSALIELDSLRKQFNDQFNTKVEEYQSKLSALKDEGGRLNAVVKKDREEELQALQASIAKFQQTAEDALKKKEQELMTPLFEKVQKAIDEVAREHDYTHILNIDSRDVPLMLYAQQATRTDSLIIQKLNLK